MISPLEMASGLAYEVGQGLVAAQKTVTVTGQDDAAHPDGKGHHAVHTAQDLWAEMVIRSELRSAFPNDSILGEERGLIAGSSSYTWVFDPIDGTSQYAAGMPADWCVSIGRWHGTTQDIAIAYVPGTDELFFAKRGAGAWLDRDNRAVRLRTTKETDLSSLLGSFGVDMLHLDDCMDGGALKALSKTVRTMRVVRSGDHELAQLAAGRIGVLYNRAQKPWDCIPLLLVEEAGGQWMRYDPQQPGLVSLPNAIRPAVDERVSYLAAGNLALLNAARAIIDQASTVGKEN